MVLLQNQLVQVRIRSIIVAIDNDGNKKNTSTITTEDRIKINIEYIAWLYAKSKERKKRNEGILLDTREAIELVIRDGGGEKALKELFLKEQHEKIIDKLLNPMIADKFKQNRQAGLQVLNEFIANLESSY
jgi:hypothetical protein